MKLLTVVLASLVLAGCFKSGMSFMMKISTWEFFEQNCPADNADSCIADVELHLDNCFDSQLAYKTVELDDGVKKCENNVALILDMEQCFTAQVGTNYWQGIDLPATFYEQTNMKRAAKGKAPYLYPCDKQEK